MKMFVVMIGCLFILNTLGFSKNYYVSATRGDDDNDGTRRSQFLTIQKAADLMAAGDSCIIDAGMYRETVTLKKSGTADKPIVFMANGDVKVSGTEQITANWIGYFDAERTLSVEGNLTYSTQGIPAGKNYTELYVDGELMTMVDKPEDLSGPNKWYLEAGQRGTRLLLWPPEQETLPGWESNYNSPMDSQIEAKIREYAFVAENINHVVLKGIKLFAAKNNFKNCKITVEK
jgi:hypothetical protein